MLDGGDPRTASGRWRSVMMNVPEVEGMRETSPRVVEKVERSSCAYCGVELTQSRSFKVIDVIASMFTT